MRKRALIGLGLVPLGFALMPSGCGNLPPDLVLIKPNYAYEDGCVDVTVSGHGFGDDVQVTVGGAPLENLTLPDPNEAPLDVGFVVYGTVPAGTPGPAEVTMTTAGVEDTLGVTSDGEVATTAGAFYYVACPAPYYVEYYEPAEVSDDTSVFLQGCGIDTSGHVQVGPAPDQLAMTSVCGTAQATFDAPANAPGTWYVGFFDSAGTQVYPDPACDITQPPGTGVDTGDTGFVDPCSGALTLTYGGAR